MSSMQGAHFQLASSEAGTSMTQAQAAVVSFLHSRDDHQETCGVCRLNFLSVLSQKRII